MTDSTIRLKHLRKSFGAKQVLGGIDLDLEPGTVLDLLGANGSGKTTLIKCALGWGAIWPAAGQDSCDCCGMGSAPIHLKSRVWSW